MSRYNAQQFPPDGMPGLQAPNMIPIKRKTKTKTKTTITYQMSDGRRIKRIIRERTRTTAPMPVPNQWQNGHAPFQFQPNQGHNFASTYGHHQQPPAQAPGVFGSSYPLLSSDALPFQSSTPGQSHPGQHISNQGPSFSWPVPSAVPSHSEFTRSYEGPSDQPTWPSSAPVAQDFDAFFNLNGMQGPVSTHSPSTTVVDPAQFAPAPVNPGPGVKLPQLSGTPSNQTSTLPVSSYHPPVQPQDNPGDATHLQQTLGLGNAEQRDYHTPSAAPSPSFSLSGDADRDVPLSGSQMHETTDDIEAYEDGEDEGEDDGEDDEEDDEEMEEVPTGSNFQYDGCASSYEGHIPSGQFYYAEAGTQTLDTMAGDQFYGSWPTPGGSSSSSGESLVDALAPNSGFNGGEDVSSTMCDLEHELFGYIPAAPTPSS